MLIMPDKVLIVDCMSIFYRSFFSIKKQLEGGDYSLLLHEFFFRIQKICANQQVGHICFCWDSAKSLRKRIYPQYKEGRKEKDELLFSALHWFYIVRKEILPRLGFNNNFMRVGFEADDLIAVICRQSFIGQDVHCIIASADSDLYQLLSDDTSMYRIHKEDLYTKQDFTKEYGIDPIFWADVKAMSGCPTDNVDGIPGVGEVTACKYIRNEHSGSKRSKIEKLESRKIIDRNMKLVRLPFENTPDIDVSFDAPLNWKAWCDLCIEYPSLCLLRDSYVWKAVFSGKAPGNGLERLKFGRKVSA